MGYISCGDFMKGKLIRDRRFDPSYTREEATRIYQIASRKYSRGYVRVSTEKMLYMADKCFWQQFWPTDEFPGEKAWIMRDAKEGKAVDEYGDTATQIDQRLKQEGSQYRQKATASSWGTRFLQPEREGRGLGQAPIRHLRIKREITDASEDTRSRSSSTGAVNSAVTRSFTKLNLIAMNTQQGDWSTCRELQHSLGIAQLPALSSVNILQTLDEMIKEEGRIPRQLA